MGGFGQGTENLANSWVDNPVDPAGVFGKDQPETPDYLGAAEAEAAASMRNNTAQLWANRPNQNSPWGAVTWESSQSIDPATGLPVTSWTQNTTLTPEQQAIFDSQQQLQGGRSDLANTLLGSAADTLGTQADWSALPEVGNGMDARNRAEDALYGRATSRLDPRFEQSENQTRTRLYNMGLREGDSAFDREMENFGRTRNDAYDAAMNEAISGGGAEMTRQYGQELQGRQQAISDMLGERSSTLNELQALINGQQVNQPQMPGFTNSGVAQTPQYLNAAQQQYGASLDQYNAQQAQQQGLMSGAARLLPYLFSDERLKENITRLKVELLPGVPLAVWTWKATGETGVGVVAQDLEKVRPDLVKCDEATGYLMVNYGGIGESL